MLVYVSTYQGSILSAYVSKKNPRRLPRRSFVRAELRGLQRGLGAGRSRGLGAGLHAPRTKSPRLGRGPSPFWLPLG